MAALAVILSVSTLQAQTDNAIIRARIRNHFEQYQAVFDLKTLKVERTDISRKGKRLDIYLNQNFSYQLFRQELIDSIYAGLRRDLPQDIRKWSIGIHTGGKTIERLVPNWARSTISQKNLWNEYQYDGKP